MRTDRNRRWDDASRVRWVVYLALVATLVAFIAGRVSTRASGSTFGEVEATPTPRELPIDVERFHDAAAGATCWRNVIRDNGGALRGKTSLSCLPDQWLEGARAEADQP